jgi:hypothetical protein
VFHLRKRRTFSQELSRKQNGFLKAEKRKNSVCQFNRELINNTPILDEQTLFVRLIKIRKQLTIEVAIKDIRTKKNTKTTVLIDSGCMRTCIDEDFVRKSGLMLTQIINPIKVEYVDGTSVEDSMIQYSTDIRIWVAGATIVMGALVARLKSAKVFLGFDWLQSVNPKIDWRDFHVEAEEGTETLKMRSMETTPDYLTIFRKAFSEDGFNDLPP